MMFIKIFIIFCAKRVLKYQQMSDVLVKQEGVRYIYSVGTLITERNKWLKRLDKLEKFARKN